ncbi:hypothetical protein [Bdellovibrio sp. HCB2-146]|uniref:hypothetical protein n=1 Tax=Bdellovibrio sp. HCB2-146 TaxID=3394362 RepID=UPI0039BD5864
MKKLIFISQFISAGILSLVSVAAIATPPQTNDRATYNVILKDARTTQVSTLEKKIEALDEKSQTVKIVETETLAGHKPRVTNSEIVLEDVQAEYSVFSECGDYGGNYEKILVPAGLLEVCGIPLNNEEEVGKAWYGLVPFGLVKKEVKLFGTNVLETTELQSFQQGR